MSGNKTAPAMNPVEFMRNRRPELFSDSEAITQLQLSREMLEHQLNTITSRNQETEFEYFCRRLAEKEICPNLRPQTGPTGGGDSKADSETIPVSKAISRVWVGANQDGGDQRWAFAFSAKKNWTSKVRSDVQGIADTGRDYKRIYFITNQFARDQTRAKIEDELARKHGIPVHILDRSWIQKCVFENDRIELAVEGLGLTGLASQSHKRVGPRDIERLQELEELEADINDPQRYVGAQYQLAEDCLHAALLARGLEKPRIEVEGHFARAERIAAGSQFNQQKLRISYERAWTAFWWYSDFAELNRLYGTVEGLAKGSEQAEDLELVVNLWQVLNSSVRQGDIKPQEAGLEKRTGELKSELDRLAGDIARPNNALSARTNRLLISVHEAAQESDFDALNTLWADFSQILKEVERLGDYPFETLAKLVKELGELVPESESFDQLFESVGKLIETRHGEGERGKTLLERGYQKLKNHRPYEAIRLFGRAQERFIKREYREELVLALMSCSSAYSQAGLLWASRNCALAAVERCFKYFLEDGLIIHPVFSCLRKLIWSELELGRVPQVLQAYLLLQAIIPQLKLSPEREEELHDELTLFDAILGILLLKSSIEQLEELRTLPNILEKMGLFASAMGVLYALGCIEELQAEGFVPSDQSPEKIDDFMKLWLRQPAAEQVPRFPNLMTGDEVEFQSNVLGCDLFVRIVNTDESIYLAESLLGALEAFLATSLDAPISPYREEAKIIVRPSEELAKAPTVSVSEVDGEQIVEILHPPTHPAQSVESRIDYRDFLQMSIITILCHIALIHHPEKYLEKLAGQERAFSRALIFAEIDILVNNIFGSSPKFRLADWTQGQDATEYPLRRSDVWNSGAADTDLSQHQPTRPRAGSGEIPRELLERLDTVPHRKRRVRSLIDIPLWNKAEWCATIYMQDPSKDPPLLLGIGFINTEPARAIFAGWHRRLGAKDSKEELRISIIKGVDQSNPHAYNVMISTNLLEQSVDEETITLTVARTNHMEPQNSENLNRFVESFNRIGRYVVAPIQMDMTTNRPLGFIGNIAIEKTELNVRPAWEIGEHDIDIIGVRTEDSPIIPPNVKDAPVVAALSKRQEGLQRRGE